MAAGMCLSGHIVQGIDNYCINGRLLDFPVLGSRFKVVKRKLAQLEGCYIFVF